MNRLQRFISDYFGMTRREANGFLVVFILTFLIVLAPLFFKSLYEPSKVENQTDAATLDSLVAVLAQQSEEVEKSRRRYANQPAKAEKKEVFPPKLVRRFPFNPNTATVAQLEELGIPSFIAKRIENYRTKGGAFRYKEDLQRIYDFPDSTYRVLYPYIQLPAKQELPAEKRESTEIAEDISPNAEPTPAKVEKAITPFELNSATAEELQQIRGIGTTLSERIISFRDKLGGFHSTVQVYEVYGLDTAVCVRLLEVATLDSLSIRKININTATQAELGNHPYIHKGLARVLVNYRSQHGNYASANDLRKIRILEEATLQKLLPYLQF